MVIVTLVTLVDRAVYNGLWKTPNPENTRWPNTYYIENPVNKSKVKVDTSSGCKTKEEGRARVAFGFGFNLDWVTK